MMLRTRFPLALIGALAACLAFTPPAAAIDSFWEGDVNNNYNTAGNWSTNFVPEGAPGISERAVIGSTQRESTATGTATPLVQTNGVATLASNPPAAGGLVLGLEATSTGSLTISSGTLNNISTSQAAEGADGRIQVGVGGRGYLIMTGGTLTGTGLVVGGEQVTTGDGVSRLDLSGLSTLTVNGTASLSRNLRIAGPSVNLSATGLVRLQAANAYTAVITSPTAHSSIKTSGNLALGGSLSVEYSGAAPALGQTWDLFDFGGSLTGNFNNLSAGGDVPTTGFPATMPGEAYRLRTTTGGTNGNLLQLIHDRVLVLRVNRDTGELSIRNPLAGAISIDGYSVNSPLGSLLAGYKGISGAPAADVNWQKYGLSADSLTELKNDPNSATSVFNLTSVPSVTLGTGFSRTAVGADPANFGASGEDLIFEYTAPGIGVVRGQVEYIGTKFENNLVLRVNQNTGQAFLKNDSLQTIKIDGYSILSSTNALSGAGWTGIGGVWEKSTPPAAGALSETNPIGSTTLAPNAQIAIGSIGSFASADAQAGLSMKFIMAESLVGGGDSPSDIDGDGDVDGADFLAIQRGLGTTTDATDIADWRTAFGGAGGAGPPETFERDAAIVFDATAGVASAAAVPEPRGALLLLVGVLGFILASRRAARDLPLTSTHGVVDALGGVAMKRRVRFCVAAVTTLCALAHTAAPASAVTQGIPLTNRRFELPGPTGTKVVAFDETGTPIPGIIPGWTFGGPGVELWGDEIPGDSGTEGANTEANGNDLLLSTFDGVVFQTSTFNVTSIPATQTYRLTFDARNIFTIDLNDQGFPDSQAELTTRLYYLSADGVTRNTIGSPLVLSALPGDQMNYTIEVLGGSAALTPAIGRPIGVEFDTTSVEFNPQVGHSWVGVDNVLLQIAGVTAGDLNGDGAVNLADYRVIRDNLQESHEFLANGDLNDDGVVNLVDFRTWKSLPAVVSSGVLAQIAAPEPASWALALFGVGAAGRLARQRKSVAPRLESTLHRLPLRFVALTIAVALALLASVRQASAELLLYEPFNIPPYTVGTLEGQNPSIGPGSPTFFDGPWAIGSTGEVIQESTLSYLGSPSQGGSVTSAGEGRVGRYLRTPWDAATEGTFYLSFEASYGTVANPATTNQADLGFRTTEFWAAGGTVGVDSGRSEIGFQAFGVGPNVGLPSTANLRFAHPQTGPIALTDVVFNDFAGTHLIVMKFVLSANDNSDSISVFLDPLTGTEPEVAQASVSNINFTLGAISTISKFGTTGGIRPIFDELRVATTYEEAIPELPLPGDTNGDRLIDLVDYNNIVSHMNQQVGTTLEGDVALANGKQGSDGRVTLGDFRLWRDNRTDLPPGAPANYGIPEPSGVLLALAAAAGLARWARRKP
jgi:hypothetical protein